MKIISLAFDKKLGLELLAYSKPYYDPKKETFFSSYKSKHLIGPLGSFLLIFLNTNFNNLDECEAFIFRFCFEFLYYEKYPEIEKAHKASSSHLKLSFSDFQKELNELAEENKSSFLYIKYTLLKNLRLPYDTDFSKLYGNDFTQEEIEEMIQEDKEFYENKSIKYDEMEINNLIENINIKFETLGLIFRDIDVSKYNIPYYFESENIFSIIAFLFKEFMNDSHNTIRQCQNCGFYFITSNLKETKYCNTVEYEDTGKTCKQIGKELAYKKAMKGDELLNKYRKRYMSLASSVSHYGTDTAIKKFEKYKKDGAVMRKKYLNNEISSGNFERWILNGEK